MSFEALRQEIKPVSSHQQEDTHVSPQFKFTSKTSTVSLWDDDNPVAYTYWRCAYPTTTGSLGTVASFTLIMNMSITVSFDRNQTCSTWLCTSLLE
eukprot:2114954-Ditylum_brightwellii.AAC.1